MPHIASFHKQESYLCAPQEGGVDWRPIWLQQLGDLSCKPYTEEDHKVFEVARMTLDRTNRWLGWRGYTVITLGAGGLVFLSTQALFSTEDERRDNALAIAFGLAATLVSNVCSMLFTGTFPHSSSNTQNADQNSLRRIKQQFSQLGIYIVMQYLRGNKEIAKTCVGIDIARIRAALLHVTTQKDDITNTVRFLEHVLKWIASVESGNPNTSYDSKLEYWIQQIQE